VPGNFLPSRAVSAFAEMALDSEKRLISPETASSANAEIGKFSEKTE
jgi:hypothetical protein